VIANRPPTQPGALQRIEDGVVLHFPPNLLWCYSWYFAAISPLLSTRQVGILVPLSYCCHAIFVFISQILSGLCCRVMRILVHLSCSFEVAADSVAGVGVAAVVSWLFGFLQVGGLRWRRHL
jgi:hypothetical protein